MSTYYYGAHQQSMQNSHPLMASSNHHGRSRRGQRMSSTQPNNRHARQQHHQQMQQKPVEKILTTEAPSLAAFRVRFEAGRSFDLDDDLEFCPNLLTWDEVCDQSSSAEFLLTSYQRRSMSSGSDRSSLSSGSPESSPLQHQIQPYMAPTSLPSAYVSPPANYSSHNNMKLHQPSAIRSRNPIPIVNPDTRTRMSPPSSISPNMMQQSAQRRW